jgi:hypothetical protein
MAEITDSFMHEMLGRTRIFTVLLLRVTDKYDPNAPPDSEQRKLVWEHGRRNFQLRASGELALVGPAVEYPYAGIGVFNVPPTETARLMDEDPAVKAGIFSYELVSWRTFPGDKLGIPGAQQVASTSQ